MNFVLSYFCLTLKCNILMIVSLDYQICSIQSKNNNALCIKVNDTIIG